MPYVFYDEVPEGMEAVDAYSPDDYNALMMERDTAIGRADALTRELQDMTGERDSLMGQLDEDGDRINCYGVAGMDITGKDPATIQKLIDIPEAARQDMFDTTLREYIRFNGMGSGESDRTAVFTRYQLSVEKSERLTGTWTLEQYERCYERAFYNIVKAANPDWKPGQRFDPILLDGVTRQSVEQQIVPSDGRTLILTSGDAIDVRA